MKSLRFKMLVLLGSGAAMLAVTGCAATQLITDLLGGLGNLIPSA
jgi:hypothetical protein